MRVSLSYGGRRILLDEGATLVGRALHCGVRFNDPSVSRLHARITIAPHGRPVIENLSRSNGTSINGETVHGRRELASGDQIRLGHRVLEVELIEEVGRQHRRPITLDSEVEVAPGSGLLVDEESAAEESTLPGLLDKDSLEPIELTPEPMPIREPEGPEASGAFDELEDAFNWHNCPRCRVAVDFTKDTCPGCGYVWPPGRPGAVTLEIRPMRRKGGRASPRFSVELPVIYSSDGLTFEATVRDISRGGMFVATELLEPVGTGCELTALPDGHPAVTFKGLVAHVATQPSSSGRPAGLGIKFTETSPRGVRWLADLLGDGD